MWPLFKKAENSPRQAEGAGAQDLQEGMLGSIPISLGAALPKEQNKANAFVNCTYSCLICPRVLGTAGPNPCVA